LEELINFGSDPVPDTNSGSLYSPLRNGTFFEICWHFSCSHAEVIHGKLWLCNFC